MEKETIRELFQVLYTDPILIGEGAFGRVYRVMEKQSGNYYALKVLSDEKLWEKEKTFLQMAKHPLFPRMITAGRASDGFYVLMEYVWGENLSDFLERRGSYSQPDAMRVALQIADGLAFLQQQDDGLVYRDLKTDNLIITPKGDVRLVDLGCVCHLFETSMTIAGTPKMSAPEQFADPENVGMSADVYAFGKVFFYLLTGVNPMELKHGEQPLLIRTYDASLSTQLELLVYQCLSGNANTRIPDMYGVLTRLVEIGSENRLQYYRKEKIAARQLKKELAEHTDVIVYSKNIRK